MPDSVVMPHQTLSPLGILFGCVVFWGILMWATEKTIAVVRYFVKLIWGE